MNNIQASYHQERLWFIDKFESGNLYDSSPIYHNIPLIVDIKGTLNIEYLEQSIREAIARHSALRTRIITVDDKPWQQVDESMDFKLSVLDLRAGNHNNSASCSKSSVENAMNLAVEETQRPFLLDKDPLIRGKLIRLEKQNSLLVITVHHIIADRYSLGILVREIFVHYGACTKKTVPQLPDLSLQYTDFSRWQREFPPMVLKSLLRYWRVKLRGRLQPLTLPTDRPRALVHTYQSAWQHFKMAGKTGDKINCFCEKEGITPMVLLAGIFKALLYRYSGQDVREIIIGTGTPNRSQTGTDNIIGPLANLLVLRSHFSRTATMRRLLLDLKRTVNEAHKYRSMPFDKLVSALNPEKDMSRTALFDVLFQYEEAPLDTEIPQLDTLEINIVETNLGLGKYDLNLLIRKQNREQGKESFHGILVYNSDYYNASTISRLIDHYRVLTEAALEDANQQLSTICLLTKKERKRLLTDWNGTRTNYPQDQTIQQIFENQVEQTPHRVALVYEDRELTYKELDHRANACAYYLRDKYNIKADGLVGISVERSEGMIVALLGILKAGGAYVPIDPDYPEKRIQFILSDSGCARLISEYESNFSTPAIPLLAAIQNHFHKNLFSKNPGIINTPDNTAYVIYTSGTTGHPKGCMVSHRNVVRLLKHDRQHRLFDFNPDDTWIMAHSFCFDFSVWEMYGALLNGSKLIIPCREAVRDVNRFHGLVKQHAITVLNQTPGAFYRFCTVDKDYKEKTPTLSHHLRYVIFGGDKLDPGYLREWVERYPLEEISLINMYGITETTVHVTFYRLRPDDIRTAAPVSPIGKPLPETTVYIYNEDMILEPVGITGELYVGGSGVSRGYLNKPELTARRFLFLPASHGSFKCHMSVIYKTGDLGKWLPDGNIEYIGRKDHQVKIRGFRIELGEIENQLLRHDGITDSVVIAADETITGNSDITGDIYLCAYLVSNRRLSVPELREYLSRTLPDYMIPSYFMQLDRIPLTPNGKVDRKALPGPSIQEDLRRTGYAAPRNKIEEKLQEIWAGVLGITQNKIGIDAGFFELGGHSLKATTIISMMHKEFNVKVPLAEIFLKPGIRELSRYIQAALEERYASIEPLEKKEYYQLSSTQKRLFILQQMESGNTNYNMPFLIPFEQEISKEKLEVVLKTLMARHESFRTSFEMISESPVQRVHDPDKIDFALDYFDAAGLEYEAGHREVEEIIAEFEKPFDLSRVPLIRGVLIKTVEKKHLLMLDMHHIITDGTSQDILAKEFRALLSGEELTPLRLQYKDYAGWQGSETYRQMIRQQEVFWMKEFSPDEELPMLSLPTDFPRPPVLSFAGDEAIFLLNAEETKIIKDIATDNDVTLYMCLLATFNILFAKLSGQEDIILGTPIAARRHADLQQVVGMLVNTLAVRNYPSAQKNVKDFLKEVKHRTLEAFENQEYPFELLVDRLSLSRDTSRNPIFDVLFNLLNQGEYSGEIPVNPGQGQDSYKHRKKTARFDMMISIIDKGERLYFHIEYSTSLFTKNTIDKMMNYLRKIVASLGENIDRQIADIEIITGKEKQEILRLSAGIRETPEGKQTIHRLFREIAGIIPHRTALVFAEQHLSYGELHRRSNQMARVLREKGVGPDIVVGMMLERSIEMITAILAILKAGGAYLPLDPEYPVERIMYMLEDSGAPFLLTGEKIYESLLRSRIKKPGSFSKGTTANSTFPGKQTGTNREVILVDKIAEHLSHQPATDLENINRAGDLIYVIYTSGSTGDPKGVMLEHRNLANLLKFQLRYTRSDYSRILQFTTISFDVSFQEIFSALLAGGSLYLISRETRSHIPELFDYLEKNRVTSLFLPMSFLRMIFNQEQFVSIFPRCVTHIQTAGEQVMISDRMRRFLQENHVYLHNHYGPAEAHVVTTLTIDPGGEIPGRPSIGKPILNTGIYILDQGKHLLPIGVPGELHIAGVQVGRGYLGRSTLTAEKFIPDTFNTDSNAYNRLYCTGDYARWLPGGEIEFLGRIDNQVKVRGFRVELGEIQSRLLNHADVKETVVLARVNNTGDKYLCAYIVSGKELTVTGLRDYLSGDLPDYMIPSYFVFVEKIPLTPNGKINGQALPAPEMKAGDEYSPPRNKIEKKLAELWSEVLEVEIGIIGIERDFFELGGHSLKATVLAAKIHKEFNIKMPLTEVFRNPTIKGLSGYISGTEEEKYTAIEPVEKKEYYVLSSAQKRLYILQQMDLNSTGYHISGIVTPGSDMDLDEEQVKAILRKLIARHESLRTYFLMVGDEPVQGIKDDVEFEIKYYEEDHFLSSIMNRFVRPFDLSKAPLVRVGLIKRAGNPPLLLLDMHHIISDGTSMDIMAREFNRLLSGKQMFPLRLYYKDYAQWQNSPGQEVLIKQQEVFWLKEFSQYGQLPLLNLPLDLPRPVKQSFDEGSDVNFALSEEATRGLKRLIDRYDVTLYMMILSVFTVLLSKLSGQEDIIIGTPLAGRRHTDTQPIIGMFLNTIVMRNFPIGARTFTGFLKKLKERTLAAYENQEYPFEELVDKISIKRDLSRNPIFDVMFNLLNYTEIPGKNWTDENNPGRHIRKPSKFDLNLKAADSGQHVYFNLEYATRLFKPGTIRRFVLYFKKIINSIIVDPAQKISDIDIIPDAVKKEKLSYFNEDLTVSLPTTTLQEKLSQSFAKYKNHVAIEYGANQVTYDELDNKSSRIASIIINRINRNDIQKGSMIGIFLDNRLEEISVVLGILKAGCVFVPFDVLLPINRIVGMIRETNLKLLFLDAVNEKKLSGNCDENNCDEKKLPGDFTTIIIDDSFYKKDRQHSPLTGSTRHKYNGNDKLYVFFTSGTTGKPKAIVGCNKSILHFISWEIDTFKIDRSFRIGQFSRTGFDPFLRDVFVPLCAGGTICIPGDYEMILTADRFARWLEHSRVNLIHCVPSIFKILDCNQLNRECFKNLKYVLLAGEAAPVAELEKWYHVFDRGIQFVNMYGPTETTQSKAYYLIDRNDAGKSRIPIGKAIPGARLILLDHHMNVCDQGIAGEIYIRTPYRTYGYFNTPELNQDRFIPNPFGKNNDPGDLLYRTGDMGRELENGNIEIIGRCDRQVKVRGNRIELGEIEAVLLRYKKIKEAVIVEEPDMKKSGDIYLCAYVVADGKFSISELREYLSGFFPDYMIPAYFIEIDKIPLTPNGKINRAALPAPELGKTTGKYIAPGNVLEKQLVEIWSGVLEIDPGNLGINANFFELGGHSLKATTLVNRLYRELKITIELGDVFINPTIRELAKRIKGQAPMEYREIAAEEEKEYYDLSYAQGRIWILCQLEEVSIAYNVPQAFKISGLFMVGAFVQAVQTLVQRHESLRSFFVLVDGRPRQKIIKNFKITGEQVELVDLSHLDEEFTRGKIREICRNDARQPFNLEKGPLFRIKLLRLGAIEYLLVCNIHHIILDARTQTIINNELIRLYHVYSNNLKNPLPPLKFQYRDYARWHNRLVRQGEVNRLQHYWLEKFKDKPNGIELPLDHPRGPVQTFNGGMVEFSIHQEKTLQLRQLGLFHEATLFMSFITLLSIFLYKYSGQNDIIIAAPTDGRKRPEWRNIIGFTLNTIVFRIQVHPTLSFGELLPIVRQEILTSYRYQDYPFDLLVEQLGLNRDLSQSPLFNVMLAHDNVERGAEEPAPVLEDVVFSGYSRIHDSRISRFDLLFFMFETGDQTIFMIEYNSDLFERKTIERLAGNFNTLVESVVGSPNMPISTINWPHPREYEQVVMEFNDTYRSFPAIPRLKPGLQQLVEHQVKKSGHKTAVVYHDETITYNELNKRANRLAHYLLETYHVKPNDIIAIFVDRSIEMIIALLGIIKAGAAYLAVDPSYPGDRVSYMLHDCHVNLVIVDQPGAQFFPGSKNKCHMIDINPSTGKNRINGKSSRNPRTINHPADVLYVTYTSGSTGKPNGIMVSHDVLYNLVQWQNTRTSVNGSGRCLQFASLNFDVSFQEIMTTLSSGGQLHLIGDMERKDSSFLTAYLLTHRIEVLYLPFYYLNFLFTDAQDCEKSDLNDSCLEHIVTAGEQLIVTTGLKSFLDSKPGVKLHNHYGPAEAHVVTSYTMDYANAGKSSLPPIGKPIANTSIYILDEYGQVVPIGVWGELYIEGCRELLGYVNQPCLTAKKLCIFPGLSGNSDHKKRKKLYRTGDIGRWMADGNIQLKGRKDSQVKIHGFRIEPGEIENRLLAIAGIRECVVLVKNKGEGGSQKYLTAYIVLKAAAVSADDIKKQLSRHLPQYMIPLIVILDRLPLLPNGKINRSALPEPEISIEEGQEHTNPRNQVERKLAKIWREVLFDKKTGKTGKSGNTDENMIGIDADFFQLGGHSLKATLLAAKIHKEFHIKVPLAEIFRTPFIRGLSHFIQSAARDKYVSIEPVEKKEYYVLSSAQKRLYFLQQMDRDSTAYNMLQVTPFHEQFNIRKLEETFKKLIKRHESLRTSFGIIDGEPVQRIHDNDKVDFEIEYSNTDSAVITREFIRPLDLSKAPLMRVGLLKTTGKGPILILDMHHIVSDGVSQGILIHEFLSIYTKAKRGQAKNGESGAFPAIKLQYKDFSEWQTVIGKDQGALEHQERFWVSQFSGEIPVLNLPCDYARPFVRRSAGSTVRFSFNNEETLRLKELADAENVTRFMLLMALFNMFLAKVTSQEDLVVGTGTAGRRHADLQQVVGFFVNTLAIRNYPAPRKTFKEFLKEVKKVTIDAFENQEFPFEDLVEKVVKDRDTSRNPLFNVMFMLQNMDMPGRGDHAADPSPASTTKPGFVPGSGTDTADIGLDDHQNRVSKFDLTLHGKEVNGALHFLFQYSTTLFKPKTINLFITYFKEIALSAAANPGKSIRKIIGIQKKRQEAVLYDMNIRLEQEIDAVSGKNNKTNTLQDRLNDSFKRFNRAIAIEHNGTTISYAQLDWQTDYIANCLLKNNGIKRSTFIGVLMSSRVDIIKTMIGVLKAGCVFVPLDPDFPKTRLENMIETTGIKYIAAHHTNRESLEKEGFKGRKVKWLPICDWLAAGECKTVVSPSPPRIRHRPGDRVYIYFTSGSTGTPKAIVGKNRSLLHFIDWEIDTFGVDETFRVSQLIYPGFDAFLRDVFVPLCSGGSIIVPPDKNALMEPGSLLKWLGLSEVNLIHCVPALFRSMDIRVPGLKADRLKSLKYVLFSGEKLEPADLEEWFALAGDRITFVNLYGPTETTLIKTFHKIGKEDLQRDRIPIGRPMRGSQAMVLDSHMNLCDPLVTGEIYIRTPYMTDGYYNDPLLNRERFLSNPFDRNPGDIIYKTGDMGRILADGTIDLLGRNDRQVKIRGIRVELEEVERALVRHPSVLEAAVVKKEITAGNELLCGYITWKKTGHPDELTHYLSGRLPAYMVPARLIAIEIMPRKPNGKIDYDNLPGLPAGDDTRYRQPGDDVEKKIMKIWTDVLGKEIEPAGVTRSFFEMGGNSLSAMSLISMMHREFHTRIQLLEIFLNPSIEQQAAVVKKMTASKRTEQFKSIEPVEKKEFYALSSAQKRLYFLQQMTPKSTAYNMPQIFVLEGVDRRKLQEAFTGLSTRHESLRTSFLMPGDEPLQKIHDKVKFEIEFYESHMPDAVPFERILVNFIRPFDLNLAPLLRVGLIKTGEARYILAVDMHHIISDGVSSTILIRDFVLFYNGKALPPLKLQYIDYSDWQNSIIRKKVMQKQKDYWIKTFSGEIPIINIQPDYPRPQVQRFDGNKLKFEIDKESVKSLYRLAGKENTTLYTVLLAVYNVFLTRISAREDIIVGTTVAGRRHVELEHILGMFVNTIGLRNFPRGETRFIDFLHSVKENTLKAFENQEYPFEELVEALAVNRDVSRNPLFDVMFLLQNLDFTREEIPGLSIKPYHYKKKVSKFDLTLYAMEVKEKLVFTFEYCNRLFKQETIEGYFSIYKEIIYSILHDPNKKISRLEIISNEEKRRILCDLNDTVTGYPKDKSLHALFEEQVFMYPDHIAVRAAGPKTSCLQMTYRELNEKSHQLALLLKESGVHDTIAGIKCHRSPGMIIGILGILKAGGAYLPIDPDYPEERSRYMLKDSGARLLLTDSDLSSWLSSGPGALAKVLNFPAGGPSSSAACFLNSQFAYVIYTSGSTGKPKGTAVTHGNVNNYAYWFKREFQIAPGDKFCFTGSFCFDMSVTSLIVPLISGASLYTTKEKIERDPQIYTRCLAENSISIIKLTPTQFKWLQDFIADEDLSSLRYIILGGEAVDFSDVRHYLNIYPHQRIVNEYGPTEATVATVFYVARREEMEEIDDADGFASIQSSLPIGRPIFNTRIYILDKYTNVVPVGVVGELCIGGDNVAPGYLNKSGLTAERFCRRPGCLESIKNSQLSHSSIYRTGDLGRWQSDNNIEYLGRMDSQVKVRGHRIELEEIKAVLSAYKGVKAGTAAVKKNPTGSSVLVAYVIPGEEETTAKILEYLENRLPAYMVPSVVITLDELPVTSSGKIDYKRLPGLSDLQPGSKEVYREPGGEKERILAAAWEGVLGVTPVGVDDNFFQLGGDSIKAIQVISRLRKYKYTLQVSDLFLHPFIRQLSQLVKKIEKAIDQGPVEGKVELTPIQKWFFETYHNTNDSNFTLLQHYNQSVMIYRKQGFDRELIRRVFTGILKHHDALRMVFQLTDRSIVQRNRGGEEKLFDLETFDLSKLDTGFAREIESAANRLQQGIDLANGPLVRLGLFRTNRGDHLLIVIHHLVVDGVSWRILLEDFALGYRQALNDQTLQFQEKTDSFQYWAGKLKEYAASSEVLEELEYWKTLKETGAGQLPVDHPLPIGRNNQKKRLNREVVTMELPEKITIELLRNVNRAYRTENNDILLAALGLAVKEWGGLRRVLIQLEGHGREEILEGVCVNRTIGWFTTLFPVALDLTSTANLSYFIKQVKETLKQIPGRGIGYGILKHLTEGKAEEITLEPHINFNYLGEFGQDHQANSDIFEFSNIRSGDNVHSQLKAPYLLEIIGMVASRRLIFSFSYNKYEYEKHTIERLAKQYQTNLEKIIEHCISKKYRELTPSDLDYNEFTIDELYALEKNFRKKNRVIEDIYRLSPMQSGMLFHGVYEENTAAYFVQVSYHLYGGLNISFVEKSINQLIKRYDILRTVFIHRGLEQPLQVILKERQISIVYKDISQMSSDSTPVEEKEKFIREFKEKDKQRSFNLEEDLLIRAAVIRLGKSEFEFIWSIHHILMDGWCIGILISDFLEIYKSYIENRAFRLLEVTPYRTYIQWLEKQNIGASRVYWQDYLEGYNTRASLPETISGTNKVKYKNKEMVFILKKEKTMLLKDLARRNRVTLNTIFQAVWGIILCRYNARQDTVFGIVVSGRPPEIANVESMMGLFINTVPVRIRYEENMKFIDLLHKVQKEAVESQIHHFCPLMEIQAETRLNQALIDHILVFQNYPLAKQIDGMITQKKKKRENKIFELSGVEVFEQSSYDFNIVIRQEEQLKIRFKYNGNVYEDDFVEKISGHLDILLEQIIAYEEIVIRQLTLLSREEKNKLFKKIKGEKGKSDMNEIELITNTPDKMKVNFNF